MNCCCEHLLLHKIVELLEHLKIKGEHTMAQIDDLNAKITAQGTLLDNLGTSLSTLATDQAKALADLKAAITAGGSTVDLTNQIQALDSNNAKLQAVADSITTLDSAAKAADVPPAA